MVTRGHCSGRHRRCQVCPQGRGTVHKALHLQDPPTLPSGSQDCRRHLLGRGAAVKLQRCVVPLSPRLHVHEHVHVGVGGGASHGQVGGHGRGAAPLTRTPRLATRLLGSQRLQQLGHESLQSDHRVSGARPQQAATRVKGVGIGVLGRRQGSGKHGGSWSPHPCRRPIRGALATWGPTGTATSPTAATACAHNHACQGGGWHGGRRGPTHHRPILLHCTTGKGGGNRRGWGLHRGTCASWCTRRRGRGVGRVRAQKSRPSSSGSPRFISSSSLSSTTLSPLLTRGSPLTRRSACSPICPALTAWC